MSRGLRNNNPGNIRLSNTPYLGEVESSDKEFKAFNNIDYGYRAMFVLLYTYQKRYACNTIESMIHRYAPAVENHTDMYIKAVCDDTGFAKDQRIDTMDEQTMVGIVASMSRVENGKKPNIDEVKAGWQLFIKHRP